MHFHTQHLMTRDVPGTHDEEVVGPLWRYGRCWWHWYPRGDRKRGIVLGAEWQIPTRFVCLDFSVGGAGSEHDVKLTLGCGLFFLSMKVDGIAPMPWRYRKDKRGRYAENRDLSLTWNEDRLRWDVWRDSTSWSSRTPRWRSGSWAPLDTILGPSEYSTRDLSRHVGQVDMPEGHYPVTMLFFESMWKRPRWPWPRVMVRADVEFETPIPFPGKGEDSWNCGEDGYSSMTIPASTPERAIAEVVQSVLQQRRKNGGSVDWVPTKTEGAR